MAALPQFVRQSEPGFRLLNAETFAEATDKLLTQERMLADLSGSFGVLAIIMASLGIYGVLSYGVVQRTREIGIRMALAARQATAVWMVLRETLIRLIAGLAAGIPVILVWGRLLASMLYEQKPADPATIGMAAMRAARRSSPNSSPAGLDASVMPSLYSTSMSPGASCAHSWR